MAVWFFFLSLSFARERLELTSFCRSGFGEGASALDIFIVFALCIAFLLPHFTNTLHCIMGLFLRGLVVSGSYSLFFSCVLSPGLLVVHFYAHTRVRGGSSLLCLGGFLTFFVTNLCPLTMVDRGRKDRHTDGTSRREDMREKERIMEVNPRYKKEFKQVKWSGWLGRNGNGDGDIYICSRTNWQGNGDWLAGCFNYIRRFIADTDTNMQFSFFFIFGFCFHFQQGLWDTNTETRLIIIDGRGGGEGRGDERE